MHRYGKNREFWKFCHFWGHFGSFSGYFGHTQEKSKNSINTYHTKLILYELTFMGDTSQFEYKFGKHLHQKMLLIYIFFLLVWHMGYGRKVITSYFQVIPSTDSSSAYKKGQNIATTIDSQNKVFVPFPEPIIPGMCFYKSRVQFLVDRSVSCSIVATQANCETPTSPLNARNYMVSQDRTYPRPLNYFGFTNITSNFRCPNSGTFSNVDLSNVFHFFHFFRINSNCFYNGFFFFQIKRLQLTMKYSCLHKNVQTRK